MVCASTELQQNTPAHAVNELHRAGVPLFYKENAQSGDFRQYRTILSAAAAGGAVLKPSGGNCAVLPLLFHGTGGQLGNSGQDAHELFAGDGFFLV